MKRRTFIESSAKALFAAPFILDSSFSFLTPSTGSHLVSVFDKRATSLDMIPGNKPNIDNVIVEKVLSYTVNRIRVSNMVDTAVKKLTGQPTVGKAWESLFPAGHPTKDTTISIKINLSYGEKEEYNDWSKMHCPYGPKIAMSDAIVMGLCQMLDGTFPIENILLFDVAYSSKLRSQFPLIQGFRPVLQNEMLIRKDRPAGTYGMHWVAPRHPLEIPMSAPRFVAAPDFTEPYQAPQRIIPPAYQSDFTINMAIAKTHREGGITGVMKNTYGCTNNPMGTHGTGSEWKYDDSPFPGSKRCAPAFYKAIHEHSPTILNVLDALSGVYYGGPLSGKIFQGNMISVSRDPVAIDTHLLHLVNAQRKQKGFSLLSTEDGRTKDGFPHASVVRNASEIHDLGSMSMDNHATYNLSKSKESYHLPALQTTQSRVSDTYLKKRNWNLDVGLDDTKRTHNITSRITDPEGKPIREFTQVSTRRSKFSLDWDHQNDQGKTVEPGLYIWQVEVDGVRHDRVINELLF